MADTLVHRGPDDAGVWVDNAARLALGFRRLAIVDLSAEGRQPMASASGRYVIAFNGEVYNFLELRHDLEGKGHRFRGHSDTEVMLAAIEEWGLQSAVRRFVGMFAFALWDRQERSLSLVRDRLGIKPLYYAWMDGVFLCGSELKALRAHPAFRAEIDRGALTLYMRHSYVPTPYSIYRGCKRLPPGCTLTLDASLTHRPEPVPYWSATAVAASGLGRPFIGSDPEAVEELDRLLRDAVRLRMIADVPLGAFLSGGVDSSTVVALMQSQSERPIRTFSIGFLEEGYNEAEYAREVAAHLGTEHTELYVTPAEAQAVIPTLPEIYDEPFADSSQIPTLLVSRLTRRHVTVSLSGDGGDELFAGYPRYAVADSLWRRIRWMPPVVRHGVATVGSALTAQRSRLATGDSRLARIAEVLRAPSSEAIYRRYVSHWKRPEEVVIGGHELPTALSSGERRLPMAEFTHRMMALDTVTYLPDDILTKVDRASMAVSLEARVPLLDHRVVEFAWRLPLSMKTRNQQTKWALRQVLYRYVPRELIERPKMGFAVPLDAWLRGPLREWAEALLAPRRLRDEGLLDAERVGAVWRESVDGRPGHARELWSVLMFQAWQERWA
jgi:asparagine synthase (glutamine-hydrolysing)